MRKAEREKAAILKNRIPFRVQPMLATLRVRGIVKLALAHPVTEVTFTVS